MALAGISEELAGRGIPMVVVALPYRGSLEDRGPTPTGQDLTHERVIAVAEELGLRVLDATPVVADAMQRSAPGSLFVGPVELGDVHFSEAGHEVVAGWLNVALGIRTR